MKTSRWFPSLFVCLAPVVLHGAQVSLGSASLTPAGNTTIDATYSGQGDQVSGIQFDLSYDTSVMTVTASLGSGPVSAAKSLYSAGAGPNQFRVVVTGFGQQAVPDGPLVSLSINVLPTAGNGTYPISIVSGTASDPNGGAVGFSTVAATVTVTGATGTGGAGANPSSAVLSVLNAASLRPGPISPGELVALFGTNIGPSQPTTADGSSGSLPTFLSGVTVTFNGIPAPLLYADTGQINAVVPYELAGQNSAVLTLLQHGSPVASVTLSVAAVSPAFFTLDEDGVGHVIAFNEDGSLNAEFNPAPAGSMLTLFLTGCGPTNPVSLTGQILPPSQTGQLALPVAGSIQGTLTSVGYAGPAPGLVSGVCIIQLRVPVGVSSSAQAGLSVQIGTEWTPERVIVAVGGS